MPDANVLKYFGSVAAELVYILEQRQERGTLESVDLARLMSSEFRMTYDPDLFEVLTQAKSLLMEKMQGFKEPPRRTEKESEELLKWRKVEEFIRPTLIKARRNRKRKPAES